MARKSLRTTLLAVTTYLAALSLGAALPGPRSFKVDARGPVFSWAPVPGAVAYRLAVLDQAGPDGKRETLAAVWVQGNAWAYGPEGVLPRVGGQPSTPLKPLPMERKLRVMVAAADADGGKGPWVSAELLLSAASPKPQREASLEIEIGERWAGPDEAE